MSELIAHGLIHEKAMTANGQSIGDNCRGRHSSDRAVIRSYEEPLVEDAGFLVLHGNLFDNAVMKTSGINAEFRQRYLSDPGHPNVLEGRAVVFEGPEDYHARIEDPALISTSTACSSSEAPGQSATREVPKSSTCSRPRR